MYMVMAYRYGDPTGYQFPVGVFEGETEALNAATAHCEYRGGKYQHRIWSCKLGQEYDAEEAPFISGIAINSDGI